MLIRKILTLLYSAARPQEEAPFHLDSIHSSKGVAELTIPITGHYVSRGSLDPPTLANLAKMAANAYVKQAERKWRPLDPPFDDGAEEDERDGFGWLGDGLRGYVFRDAAAETVVIAFKGTSTLFSGILAAHTRASRSGQAVARGTNRDREQDNLMFSCCCAKVDVTWRRPVCECHRDGTTCSWGCLQRAARDTPGTYFGESIEIWARVVQRRFPEAKRVILTGHSLGGAIAALLAAHLLTESPALNVTAVTFAAPGMALFAQRLGLTPQTDGMRALFRERILNFGTAEDPIFRGDCQGIGSPCYLAGYAMETRCRLGSDCVYRQSDSSKSATLMDLSKHRIDWLIDNAILAEPIPPCVPVPADCRDCPDWTFAE